MEQLLSLFLKNGLKPLLFDQELGQFEKNITRSELIALIMLRQRGESTMSELAAGLGTPLSTVTSICQRLSRRGYIERRRDPRDQRVILARLTEEGNELAAQVLDMMNRVLQGIKQALTEEELEQFITLSIKVAKAVQTMKLDEEDVKTKARRISIDD